MRLPDIKLFAAALAAGASVLALSAPAQAQTVACTSLENRLISSGGSAITPTYKAVAPLLREIGIVLLHSDPSACTGYNEWIAGRIGSVTRYWDESGNELTCTLPDVAALAPDFATMAQLPTTCPNVTGLPPGAVDVQGPVQSTNVIANRNSSQTAISQQALYRLFGLGDNSRVAPWTDEGFFVKRTASSAVHLLVAQAIGLPPNSFKAVWTTTSNQQTVDKIVELSATASGLESAIGYVSGPTAIAPINVGRIKTLAYQHTDQSHAYWPDRNESARDKINVRTGQYFIWSANHFYVKTDASGTIANPAAKRLIVLMEGRETGEFAERFTQKVIESGNIPQCAMRVRRDGDLTATYSWAPPVPCGCFFEKVATGATACTPCTTDAQCTSQGPNAKCRTGGYCEAY